MPALKWHEWVLTAWGTFHHEGLEINVTTALISFSEALFCPMPPSCSLRTLWQCIDLWRKGLFFATIHDLQLAGGWEPWIFDCPLRRCDKGLVFTAPIKVTETHCALQLRCRSEEEVLQFYCRANLPESTLGTIHRSYWPSINTCLYC